MNILSHTPESFTKYKRTRRITTAVAGAAACMAALTACSGSDNSPSPQSQSQTQTKATESFHAPSPTETTITVSEDGEYSVFANNDSRVSHITDKKILSIMSQRHDLALKTLAQKDPDTAAFFKRYESTSLYVNFSDISQPEACTGELAVPMPMSEDIGALPSSECELIFKAIPLATQR